LTRAELGGEKSRASRAKKTPQRRDPKLIEELAELAVLKEPKRRQTEEV
jgi:hypothetical protein